jgi:hypothetical protein
MTKLVFSQAISTELPFPYTIIVGKQSVFDSLQGVLPCLYYKSDVNLNDWDVQGTAIICKQGLPAFSSSKLSQHLVSKGIETHIAPTLLTDIEDADPVSGPVAAIEAYISSLKVVKVDQPPTESDSKFKSLRHEQLFGEEVDEWGEGDPVEFTVDNMFHKKGLSIVYGNTQAGKTTALVDMLCHSSSGITWQGRDLKELKICYFACEGAGDIKEKVWAYREFKNKFKSANFRLTDSLVNFGTSDEDCDVIIDNLKSMEIKPDFVILDTLSQIGMGLNFNSSEMGVVLGRAMKLRDAIQTNVILVAHTGKDEAKGIAGWNGFKTNADTVILVSNPEEGGDRTWKVEKVKGKKSGETLSFEFEDKKWIQNEKVINAPLVKYLGLDLAKQMNWEQRTLVALRAKPNQNLTELSAYLSFTYDSTTGGKTHTGPRLKKLLKDKLIKLVKGSTTNYELTKEGEKEAYKALGVDMAEVEKLAAEL